MNNELAIIKRENVEMIVSSAPQAFSENKVSNQRCLEAGNALLDKIQQQGMSDELDMQAASFIEKARKTVKKMNDKRSPVTKLFDEIRTQYTSMESEVDPSKKDSIPYRIQQYRNEYAAKKRAEEERKRRALIIEQERQQAKSRYRAAIEQDYRNAFNSYLNGKINELNKIFTNVTLENYADSEKAINNFSDSLGEFVPHSTTQLPSNVDINDLKQISNNVWQSLSGKLAEQYCNHIVDRKLELVTLLPSKKAELERAAKATAEEAERIKREMAEREAADAAKREAERKEQEAKEQQAAALQQQTQEMTSLFDSAASSVAAYIPKSSVKKKLVLLNPEGIMPVIALWWQHEGCRLTVDELAKTFKKQITAMEKLANKEGIFVQDESVCYEDDVKAK